MATIKVKTLEEGSIYIRGRDTSFRPIIFIDLNKIDLEEKLVDDYIDLGVRMMEYCLKYVLFPGKVEQWTVFVDMGKKWFEGLNITNIEKVFATF